jgi:hypothetical protein
MKRLFSNKRVTRRNDGFRMEALEPRVLLSADPVLGAVHMVLLPDGDAGGADMSAYEPGQFDGLSDPVADAPPAAPAALQALAVDAIGAPQAAGFMDSGVRIAPLDPNQAIVIGAAGGADAMSISVADIQAAGAAGGAVVVGSADGAHVIAIGQAGAAAPVVLNNTLILANPQQGGEIFVNSALQLGGDASLVIYGSGHTTIYSADTTTAGDILDFDSVKVVGTVTLTAGSDGSGNLQLGASSAHTVDGDGDDNADRLTLRAPGNISIKGTVGGADALENLTVTGVLVNGVLDLPDSVTFDKQVTVDGDFQVNSSGTVTFRDTVYVQEGGNLSILHAANVVFEKGIVLSGGTGNILVEGDEISFKGGNESVAGSGELQLRPTTVGLAIELGTPVNSVSSNTLNIDNGEILTFADGFSKIVIGHAANGHAATGTGAVRIGAINLLSQPTLRDALEVYGGSITVEDYSTPDYTLQVNGKVTLDALGAITIANQVDAIDNGVLQDITLYSSGGAVSQVNASADGLSAEVLRAAHLEVHAAAGINLGNTELASASLQNSGSGNIVLKETAAGGDLQLDLVRQLDSGAAGAIDISTTAGSLTVAAGGTGVAADGGGAVTLTAAGSGKQLALNQDIGSAAGAITLNSGADIVLAANVASRAGGLVALNAAGSIGMGAATSVSSTHPAGDSGEVRLSAGGAIALARLEADGAIAITARNGAIASSRAADALNLDGDTAAVTLSASAGLGSASAALQSRVRALSAANTASGGLYLRELTGLSLAGGAYAIDLGGSGGALSIVTVDGGIAVDGAVRSTGSAANLLLLSGEAAEASDAGFALRAGITSSTGSISLLSADDLILDDLLGASAPVVRTLASTQTIDLAAGGAVTFEGAAQLATNGGNVRVQSAGAATIGSIQAGTGRISISAGGAILDAQDDDAAATRSVNLAASAVRLEAAAIGSGAAALETATATLAARAGTGGAYLAETDGLTVGSVAAVAVSRVGAAGSTSAVADSATLAGLSVGSNADAVLIAGGNLTLDAALSAPGSGNVRIESRGTLAVNALVDAGSGNLTLLAGGTLTQSAAGLLKTAGGSIDVDASGGAIAMADGSAAQSDGGTIRYRASGDAAIALLDARTAADRLTSSSAGQAGWGAVGISAGGAILVTADAAAATDVLARELRLAAGSGIASAASMLDIDAALLSADAGSGDLAVLDLGDLIVGQTAALLVNRVRADGSVAGSAVVDAAQANLGAGRNLVLRTVAGSISTLASGAVSAGRNLLLQAGGSGNLVLGGAVANSGGHTSLVAGGNLLQSADVRAQASGATVALSAAGRIAMDAGATTATSNGDIALNAGADIGVGKLDAGSLGKVRLASGAGSILDAGAAGDTDVNVAAGALQMAAGGAIGAAGNHLETTVGTLAAAAGSGGLYVRETDGLSVGTVSAAVNAVAIDGAAGLVAGAAQSGLSTASGGNLVLASAAGDLVVSQAVNAVGAGNVLLQASNGTLTLDAAIDGGSGHVSVIGGGIRQNASIATGGSAGIELMAYDDILMAAGTRTSAAGNVRYAAEDLLAVGAIESGAGVSLAGSAIADAGVAGVNVTAATLRLEASGSQGAGGIGSGAEHLETAAAIIAAKSTGSGVFLGAAGAVTVGQLGAVAVSRVTSDGATVAVSDAALSDLVSSGQLVLQAGGTITVNEGSANGSGISAGGNLLLQAGSGSDLVINAAVRSSAGHMSLEAGRDLRLNAEVQAQGNARTLTLDAGGDIAMANGVAARTTNGGLALTAGANALIETLASGSAHTSVSARGSIVDADGAGDSEVDITGSGLRLQAGGAIGAEGNAIETTVLTLSGQAGTGGMFVTETNGLSVDTVTVRVNRVDAAGNATLNTLAQADLAAADGGIALATTGGNLVIGDEVRAGGAGKVLLKAADGAILVNSAVASGSGSIALAARSTINLGTDGDLTSAGGAIEAASTAGVVTMAEGAVVQANGGALRIQGLGDLTVGAVQGQGNLLAIQTSAGATAIQLGGGSAPAGGTRLSSDAIAAIDDGFSAIVVGTGVPGQDIDIAGSATPVVFHDQLVLNASGNGSVIHIEGTLAAEGLAANGAVEIAGGVNLSTGNGASAGGDLVFVKNIDGAAGSINDLVLAAGGDNVVVQGSIGSAKALDSLTIRDAANVSFAQAVTLDGDLVIHASGVVRFDGLLTLNGGTLTIAGASQVIIGDIVVSGHGGQSGPLVLEADTLALHGSISGADTVVVKTADPARGITIGTGSTDAGTLNIDAATLARLASAGQLVFGSADATGKVTLGAIDLGAITPAPIEVHGGVVELLAGSGVLKTGAALLLDGDNGVLLGDDIAAGGAVKIASSAGGVTMAGGTHVLGGGRIEVTAHGDVRIGQLQADLVVVDSAGVMSGNGDGNVNIVAKQASLHGLGPVAGQGNALLVQAPVLHVAAPTGVVVQDTDPDGRTHFYLLDGGKMYEQAVALGSVERVSQDPAAPAATLQAIGYGGGALVEPMASLLDDSGWASSWTTGSSTSSYLSGKPGAGGAAQAGLLSAGSLGIAQLLGQSYALGSAGQQVLSTGQPAAAAADFDYWLEELAI